MLGINKAPIIDDLESILFSIHVTANPSEVGRGKCIALVFQNPLLQADDDTANTAMVRIGDGAAQPWLLLPGQESPIFYAEDLKDIYTRVVFPLPNPNGVITAAGTLAGSRGTGYVTGDAVVIQSPGGTNATATVSAARGEITTAILNNAGAGYTAADVLTVQSGDANATIVVDTVDGGGAILTFHITAGGTNYLQGIHAVTGGTGAGAMFDATVITGEILGLTIVTGGTLFVVGGHYDITGGSGNDDAIAVVDTVTDSQVSTCELTCLMYRRREGGYQ